jgi:dihydroorotate dehydrogenase (NAD+) catalytic subunit
MARTELNFSSPYMNAAGTSGFSPSERWSLPEEMGVFVTNPISFSARKPAITRAVIPFSGSYLLHSGLPNPGLRVVVKKYALHWARAACPVWVHLIPASSFEANSMVHEVEGLENVSAIEIGLEVDENPETALSILSAAVGELPLVASLPFNAAGSWLKRLPDAGATTVTLSAPRGMLNDPTGHAVAGRLYGPALLPLMMAAVAHTRRQGLSVIAGAGAWSQTAALALLAAGASAVQVDGILWRGGIGW